MLQLSVRRLDDHAERGTKVGFARIAAKADPDAAARIAIGNVIDLEVLGHTVLGAFRFEVGCFAALGRRDVRAGLAVELVPQGFVQRLADERGGVDAEDRPVPRVRERVAFVIVDVTDEAGRLSATMRNRFSLSASLCSIAFWAVMSNVIA